MNQQLSKFTLKPWQNQYVFSKARYPGLWSAWGTGKTLALIMRAMIYASQIPNNLGVIFRKQYTDLRDSTVKDFTRYTGLVPNSNRTIILPNKSEIMFRHIEELNNIQNINLGFFGIEQAEELDGDNEFMMLFGRLRREVEPTQEFLDDGLPLRSGFVIGNAGDHWGKTLWKDQQLEGYAIYEAATIDNADNLPSDFIKSLQSLEKTKPEMYRKYVLNDWSVSKRNQVFPSTLIELMKSRDGFLARHSANCGVSVDPSGEGVDDNVFMVGKGGEPLHTYRKAIMSPTEKAIKAVELCKQFNGFFIIVDCDGIGIETYSELNNLSEDYLQGIQILKFHGSAKSEIAVGERLVYMNLRAEAAFTTQKRGWAGRAAINDADTMLIEDLKADEYEEKRGMIALIPKKDIKERLGRSPGLGDCYKMLQWATEQELKANLRPYEKKRKVQEYAIMDDADMMGAEPTHARMW